MSGPIVRSGASPEFSKNWDKIFGKKKAAGKASAAQSSKAKPKAKKKSKKS